MILVAPIADDDLTDVAFFLRKHLNHKITLETWVSAFSQSWAAEKPNNGFMMMDGAVIVGVLGAIYSDQMIRGDYHRFCNLTSLFLLPKYRGRAIDLFARCLAQSEYNFTNFTPNKVVQKICILLKFQELRCGEYIVPNLPVLPAALGIGVVPGDRATEVLPKPVAQTHDDHRHLPWLKSLIIGRRDEYCLVIYRQSRVTRFRIPAAAILHVSDPDLFRRYHHAIGAHLLLHHGFLAHTIDRRLLPEAPSIALENLQGQARLFRGKPLNDFDIPNLYSELVALPL